MAYIGGVIGIAIVLLVGPIHYLLTAKKRTRAYLEASFGQIPERQDYDLGSIRSYYDFCRLSVNDKRQVDDITWDDLEMDKVFRRMNACHTSIGEEYLYQLLHTSEYESDKLEKREAAIAVLEKNKELRLKIQAILCKLGKKNYNGLTIFFEETEVEPIKNAWLYTVLGALPILSILTLFLNWNIGVGILILATIINICVYFYSKQKTELGLYTLGYFSSMLRCCNMIKKIDDVEIRFKTTELLENYEVFKSLKRKIPMVSSRGLTEFEFLTEYIKILFLTEVRKYNKALNYIKKNRERYQKLYECFGELDAMISILSYRKSLPIYCRPKFGVNNIFEISDLYHPMIQEPVTNTIDIKNNCIITGSNASGKSTFLKAVAINGILAQSIYTCTASSYQSRFSLVMTSMAVRDHITEGDSYFVTEIKSLKRILDTIEETPCLCFIDEILKGTNTIERIAASAAVLKQLSQKDCLCMVASHDIELTEILKNIYDNYHFSEQITDDGIFFDYLIKKGPSQTRNAIKLLQFMEFEDDVVKTAEDMVGTFISKRKWEKLVENKS